MLGAVQCLGERVSILVSCAYFPHFAYAVSNVLSDKVIGQCDGLLVESTPRITGIEDNTHVVTVNRRRSSDFSHPLIVDDISMVRLPPLPSSKPWILRRMLKSGPMLVASKTKRQVYSRSLLIIR